MYKIRINCHDVFTISRPSEGTFRLEIHAAPDELDPDEARRLRAVLLGLAAELERDESPSNTDREGRGVGRDPGHISDASSDKSRLFVVSARWRNGP